MAFLPSIEGRSIGSHPDVCRTIKGVFEERPSLLKYKDPWDVNVVLKYLDSLPVVEDLSLKELTLRMCMLLALVTGQRGQALHLLKVKDLNFQDLKCTILFLGKQTVQTRVSHRTSRDLASHKEF